MKKNDNIKSTTQKKLLNSLYHNSPYLVYTLSPDGNILDANKKFLERTGYTRKEISDLNIYSLVVKKNSKDLNTSINNLKTEDDNIENYEASFIRKNNTCLALKNNFYPIFENQNISEIQCIAEEVHDTKIEQVLNDLNSLVVSLSGVKTLREGYSVSMNSVLKILKMNYGAIALYNEIENINNIVYQTGLKAQIIEELFYILNTPNKKNKSIRKSIEYYSLKETTMHKAKYNALIYPIEYKNKKIGYLILVDDKSNDLSDSLENLLNSCSSIIGCSIYNLKTEDDQTESEERYRHIAEMITDYIYSVKIENGVVKETIHENSCQSVTGYSVEELNKDQTLWLDMVPKEEHHMVLNQVEQLLIGNKPKPLEHRIIKKDGKIRWIRSTQVPHFNEKGEIISYDGIITDITDEKIAKAELAESEDKFRNFVELLPQIVFEMDMNDKIVSCNSAGLELLGYTQSDLENGISIEDLFDDEELKKIYISRDKVLKGQNSNGNDYKLLTKNKEILYVLVYSAPVWKKNKIIGIRGIAIDISDYKRVTEEVRMRDLLVKTAINAICISDIHGKLIYVNDSCVNMWGYSSCSELTGKHIIDLCLDNEFEDIIEIVKAQGWKIGELVARRKNNTLFDIKYSLTLVKGDDGKEKYISGSFLDITEQKKVEKEFHKSQQRLHEAQHLAKLGSWEMDIVKDQLFWSDEIYSIFGLDSKTFKPSYDAFLDRIHPDDVEKVNKAYQVAIKKNIQYEIIHRIIAEDGKIKHVHEKSTEVLGKDGQAIRSHGTVQDITERVETEKELEKYRDHLEELVNERTKQLNDANVALQQSEKQFKDAVQYSSHGMVITDLKGKFILVNKALCGIIGYTEEELLQKKFADIAEKQNINYERKNYQKLIKGAIPSFQMEKRYIHKKGYVVYVLISISIARDIDNKPKYFIAQIIDITRRKRTEDAMSSALNISHLANANTSKVIRFTVEEAVRITGSKFGYFHFVNVDKKSIQVECWSKNVKKLYGKDTPPLCLDILNAGIWYDCVKMRTPIIHNDYKEETNYDKLPYVEIKVERNITIPVIDSGKVVAIIGVADKHSQYDDLDVDQVTLLIESAWTIIQRKYANDALSKNEKKLKAIFSLLPVGVAILDEDRNIIDANNEFKKIIQFKKHDLTGQKFKKINFYQNDFTLMPPEKYPDVLALNNKSMIKNIEMGMKNNNSEFIWINVNAASLSSVEERVVVTIVDITARKAAEEKIKRARKDAEAATKSKSDFLANMSHEIRTPMNAIIGMNQLLQKTKLNLKQRDYVNKIYYSSHNLLGIINDILDFSKIEAGKLDIEAIAFNLNDVLNNLGNMVSIKAQDKELALIFSVDKDVPISLEGDPLRLGQVLLNLTNNAIKFTNSGKIVVSVELDEKLDNWIRLKISVSDTGVGIDKVQQKILFSSFNQADSTITRKYGGTGLGLAISKNLVELMGGVIGVKSQLGKGSTFSFTVICKVNDWEKRYVLPKKMKGMSVLVVDDAEYERTVLKDMLQDFKLNVETASNGDLAIEKISYERKKYDLVFMDWKMPGLNGIEVSKLIYKKCKKIHKPKIIMLTGFCREEIMKEADDIGLDGFLVKPITQSLLFDSIMQAFGFDANKDIQSERWAVLPEGFEKVRGAKILLVEDNEINQQVAQEILEDEGFYVEIVCNGKEAIEELNKSRCNYDAILMDLQMPIMDGYTATKKIRKNVEYNNIPIIAMTADAMRGVHNKVLECGMNDYVTKPIDRKNLFMSLVKWIKPAERKIFIAQNKVEQEIDYIEDDFFERLHGIDTGKGLKKVLNNRVLYKNLLFKFIKQNKNIVKDFQKALKQKEFLLAERIIHSLKGVAGNIGAENAYWLSSEISESLKSKRMNLDRIESLVSKLENELTKIFISIESYDNFAEDINYSQKNNNSENYNDMIKELKKLLETYDTKAMKVLSSLENIFKRDDIDCSRLKNYIENYNYEEALFELKNIQKKYTG